MFINSLLYLSWLPKTKLLASRFARYWVRDLWFYGSLVFAVLFVSSNLFNKSIDFSTQSMVLSEENSQILSASSQKILKNINHLSHILKTHGVSEKDKNTILNLVSKHFENSVICDAQIDLSGQFNSEDSVFKINHISIKAKGVEFEIIPTDLSDKPGSYVLNVLKGDEVVKMKVRKASSLKNLLKKVDVPFSVFNQCKKAYLNNQFQFSSVTPSYIVYQNPGKYSKDYKLLLLGNGGMLETLKGVVLANNKVALGKKRFKYVTDFMPLGERVSYKTSENVRYENVDTGAIGSLSHPLPGASISSGYGYRTSPRKGFHHGIDYRGARGTPVRCALGGKVIIAQRYGAYGNLVIVASGSLKTVYAHLHKINVRVGQNVDTGLIVGTVGATGRATGTHLHFEVRKNNKAVNPLLFLGGANSSKRAIRELKKERVVLAESAAAKSLKAQLMAGLI